MSALEQLKTTEAAYWDCDESAEQLSHDHPAGALESHLDGWVMHHDSRGMEAQLREIGPIQIWPWHRKTIAEGAAKGLAERAMDCIDEALSEDEDYGDPDGTHDLFGKAVMAKHLPAFEAAVKALLADADCWQCEAGAPIALTPDDVITLMREFCPEWFEVTP